ncbi:MAG: hypothetical protein E7427_00615 [Ruminococcaceae bacterium]|nr:hypothetical protein [Oscillospiraceae bacterium]
MAKTYLGIDIGHDMLKLALVKGGAVKKTATAPMPLNLLREGRVTSPDSMGELLAQLMKESHIRASQAAVILSSDISYLRTTSMPRMNAEQLAINIPYEFSDYITGELKSYLFDYAVVPDLPGEEAQQSAAEEEGTENGEAPLQLLVAAVQEDAMTELRQALRKAGMKLAKAAPAECAFLSLIREYEAKSAEKDAEYCILDLGYRSIRMYMFHGPRHITTRALEIGLSSLIDIIAENKGVDTHLAHTYLLNNFEDCQNADFCRAAYDNISVELMRALNFYRFSNPNSVLSDLWLCGGGAVIQPLADTIGEMLDLQMHPATELVPGGDAIESCNSFVQAIGIAMS